MDRTMFEMLMFLLGDYNVETPTRCGELTIDGHIILRIDSDHLISAGFIKLHWDFCTYDTKRVPNYQVAYDNILEVLADE